MTAEQELASVPPAPSHAAFAAGFPTRANLLFIILLIVSLGIFWTPLSSLVRYSLWGNDLYDKYSYTMAIPFITGVLAFFERGRILTNVRWGFLAGALLLATGLALDGAADLASQQLGADFSISIRMLGLIVFWLGAFTFAYGTGALWRGRFPLLFMLLTVPIPDRLLDKPITAVQYGSTGICSLVFRLAGIPVLRKGLEFDLSNVSIIVAKECSGIHSTLAILIVSLVAGHLLLPSVGKRVVLVLFALPIVCVTNGLRIAGLTLLANYLNPDLLEGNLHRQGGMGFFALALLLLYVILRLLERGKITGNRDQEQKSATEVSALPAE